MTCILTCTAQKNLWFLSCFSLMVICFYKRKNTLYSLKSRRYRVFSFGADNGSRTRLCSLGSCRSTDELHPRLVHIITNAYFLCNTKNVAPSPVNFPKTAGFPALEMAVFHRHPQPARSFVFPGCTVVPSFRNSPFFLL